MTYSNATERQAFIAGLRSLADFMTNNPDVPAPLFHYVLVFPSSGTKAEKRAEIDKIASRIGSGTESSARYGHYSTSRHFGPVEYKAVAIHDNEIKDA